MRPKELADLAEEMVPVAQRLIGAVHDEGPGGVARVLAGRTHQDLTGLAVVLAAMVDDSRTPTELLAWVDWLHAPNRAQATLFEAMTHHTPAPAWPDYLCRELHREYRQEGLRPERAAVARLGYLEWEKRRKHARKAAAKPTTQNQGTRV